MTSSELSTVVSSDKQRRNTIVNLKHVNELPLRNVLLSFDRNGDGKIDITELQRIMFWYGLWKYASVGLCMVVFTFIWSTFGLTVWAINLTKEYTVTDGVLTGGDEVVKMSVASTYIPLNWATLLDRRHLDVLDSLTINVTVSSGKFTTGMYHMKVASYLHASATQLKVFGVDGSRVWINSGTVVLHHPDADEALMICGIAACNTLAVDVKPEYIQDLVMRAAELLTSQQEYKVPSVIEGVTISQANSEDGRCMALTASASHYALPVDLSPVDHSKYVGRMFFAGNVDRALTACIGTGGVQGAGCTSAYTFKRISPHLLNSAYLKKASANDKF